MGWMKKPSAQANKTDQPTARDRAELCGSKSQRSNRRERRGRGEMAKHGWRQNETLQMHRLLVSVSMFNQSHLVPTLRREHLVFPLSPCKTNRLRALCPTSNVQLRILGWAGFGETGLHQSGEELRKSSLARAFSPVRVSPCLPCGSSSTGDELLSATKHTRS